MAVQLTESNNGQTLEVRASGKLTADDYKRFIPELERLIQQHRKISLLFEMREFHGWQAGALWQDIKFGFKHFADIERLAMVGDKKWEKWMADFCQPFTAAKVRYFDRAESESARCWVAGQPVKAEGKASRSTVA